MRAFDKKESFEGHAFSLIDRYGIASIITSGVWCWMSIRLSFMSSLVLAAGCAVCIIFRGSVDSIKLSLMLQYLLNLQ